ncbi:MAG: hypothetical protein COZ49_00140 [Candidatus Yonathbacteria bacterium CG_4_10_14_3_um_filter_47_65]|uniref:Uncharacterized protein n=2 Tax=Parcubacteria group TaxID=1794811 RepID=A0A2M8D8H2_9BACT|nr:MAG: hypothetical protein AUJ44_02415 [Candidatus Nomurabacteria bacterium CG1_02_47_685]PIP03866.1 MAG: hypothetical protein COX54_02145 [Candidatus Yonathbacteria bacterium CG23_combo_of_CG06-09_8_20_14_all_46_18]PIQ31741.1 MAG: hypothetical protein COW61_03410 [Candidatus Yonathbacteria bacterium CG17_big_fil_post_rev_8_21_14_2_50_46_19]PIX56805.1 MAG: hypothetical protein COZ49_00140 [Candidatus Yonathbacteria bacterium CG_4_10_14_3_um_filter_47_65]PIY57711.1 MAG: hypothetical protein CO
MSEQVDVYCVLWEWGKAKHWLKSHSAALLSSRCVAGGIWENEQTVRSFEAIEALFLLYGLPDLPLPLQTFFAAIDTSGCPACLMAAEGEELHLVCAERIRNYFEAENTLLEYIENTFPQ